MADVLPRGMIRVTARGECGEEISYTLNNSTLVKVFAQATTADVEPLRAAAQAAMTKATTGADGAAAIDSATLLPILLQFLKIFGGIKPAPNNGWPTT